MSDQGPGGSGFPGSRVGAPDTSQPAEPARDRIGGLTQSLSRIQVLLAAFTAVILAAGGLWATVTNFGHDDTQPPAPAASSAGVTIPPQVETSSPQVETSPPDSTASPSASTVGGNTQDPPLARHSGDLDLTESYYADLDTLDSNWDVSRNYDSYSESGDLGLDGGYSYSDELTLRANTGSDLALVTGSEDYDTCAAATGYQDSVRFDQLKQGTKICVRTGEQRLALAVVRSAARNPRGVPAVIHFRIVVWDQPAT